jgi:hypothetical protein
LFIKWLKGVFQIFDGWRYLIRMGDQVLSSHDMIVIVVVCREA